MTQYDKDLAVKYSGEGRLSHPQNSLPYATWIKAVGAVEGFEILDLACGSGFSSRMLAECGARVTALDVAPDMIAIAPEHKNITYQVMDCSLPFNLAKTFDMVTAAFLFNYAESYEKLLQMAKNAAAHLKKGKRLVALTTPPDPIIERQANASHASFWLDEPYKEGSRFRLCIFDLDGNQVCAFDNTFWSQKTHERALTEAGFVDIRWIELEATKELKQFSNWQELERHNCSIVVTSTLQVEVTASYLR